MRKRVTSFTHEELRRLDVLLQGYVSAEAGVQLLGPSLSNVYEYSRGRADQGRFVAACVDLQLGSALLACDFFGLNGVHHSLTGRRSRHRRSPLGSPSEFTVTFRWYRTVNAFVLRYRAQWDKIMGFLILMYRPESYDAFVKADSRKKKFSQLAQSFPAGAIDVVPIINREITRFDDVFRTGEAHGTGSVRKWVLSAQPAFETPQVDLVAYWNLFGHTMERIAGDMRSSVKALHG